MKKVFVKGHPLTEDVMKEVKGGGEPEITFNVEFKFCPVCGYPVIAKKIAEGCYVATCTNCTAPLPEMD